MSISYRYTWRINKYVLVDTMYTLTPYHSFTIKELIPIPITMT